jgi:hypothetical protein
MFGQPFFLVNEMLSALQRVSIRVVVAPGPVFVLLFFLGVSVLVILAMFFGKETAPRGLLVVVPLAVITIFLSSGRRRLGDDESGAERSDHCCGKQNRGQMFLGFMHSGSSEGMKTESAGRGLYGKFRRVRMEFVYEKRGIILWHRRELFRRVGGMRMNSMAIRRSMRL